MTILDLIAIDTETGGTRPAKHALLSIAAVASWDESKRFVVHLKPEPGYTVEAGAARVNGYTEALWAERGACSLAEGMRALVAWLALMFTEKPRALMLAHNAGFDRMFLDEAAELAEVKLPIRHAWRCSMDKLGTLMDRGLIPWGKAKLDRLGELAGLWPVGGRPAVHEAGGDALACLKGYQWLLEKEGAAERTLSDLAGMRLQRIKELEGILNTPEFLDFMKAVPLEAAHQLVRWGPEHDASKEPQDWYWLVGYVAGKALRAQIDGNREKALHHCVTVAACACNWHAHVLRQLPAPEPIEGVGVALCHDCKRDYTTMPLDVVLPDEQWRVLCPEGGILCADCLLARASCLPGVMVARMTLEGLELKTQEGGHGV